MDSSSLTTSNSHLSSESNDSNKMNTSSKNDHFTDLRDQVLANLEKPNIPNVNVPERIIICLDICHENNSLFQLADGTTFTPLNMMKRVLDFFIHSKLAINKKTQFAFMVLNKKAKWVMDFTSNIKTIFNLIDCVSSEENDTEFLDFKEVFQLLKEHVQIPEYRQGESTVAPPYVVRMLLLYGRSNCVPMIPQDDAHFMFLKKQPYFNIDMIYAHEEDCGSYKCAEIYDCLQNLDNGYSYVYEVTRNATKIHGCAAMLLAHPLQRVLQKNVNYNFGTRLELS